VFCAHTGNPRRWVGSPLLILLALFRCTLLERLFFLTPGPCASFKSGFKEFLFLLFFQTVFVELWEPELRSRDWPFGRNIPDHQACQRAGRTALPAVKNNQYSSQDQKMDVHRDLVAVVGGFLSCLFQAGFELLDSLIEGSIVIETFRLEQIL
jgi:hypothetical protein